MSGDALDRPLRVLHCPTDVGGGAAALARAERRVGLDSTAVTFVANSLAFPTDEVLWQPGTGLVRREGLRWGLLRRAVVDFDVVHFNFGHTIMPSPSRSSASSGSLPAVLQPLVASYRRVLWQRDLPLLRAAGKGVVVTFQGDDARQGDYCKAHFSVSAAPFVPPTYYSPEGDALKRKGIRRFDRWAHRIYAQNPDLLHVLPDRAELLPYATVDPRDWSPAEPAANPVPVVLHAPTHRGVKGTEFLLAAADRLRREGVRFELVLVENLPHEEARRLYAKADLVVDQLLVGWYGGFGLEMMALAKPVVCYIRDEDLRFLPPGMRSDLPVINAQPETVYHVLRRCLTDERHTLAEVGRRSRAYVERWHDPLLIATRLKEVYHEVVGGVGRPGRRRRRAPSLAPADATEGAARRSATLGPPDGGRPQ